MCSRCARVLTGACLLALVVKSTTLEAHSVPRSDRAELALANDSTGANSDARTGAVQARRIHGRVIDATTGRVLPDVLVRITGPDSVVRRTDARGMYRTPAVRAGRYLIHVASIGYIAHRRTVDLTPTSSDAADVRVDIRLDRLPIALEQLVVTAARRSQRLADAVQTVDVISRSAIEATGATDLASVLAEQAGIALQQGHPAGAGVMLQGLGSERVLILLDGQPVAGRLSGVFDVSRIPTSIVDRVEVVKGPQSALYGTDAMGGVINIITRRPAADAFSVSVTTTAGTQARRDGSAALSYAAHGMSAAIDVGHRHTETTPGLSSAEGALAARTDAALRLRAGNDSSTWVEASVLALDERQRWRTSTFYNFGDNRQWSGRISAGRQFGRHRIVPTLSASSYDHLSRASTAPMPFAGDAGQRQLQRVHQAELLYNGRFGSEGAHAVDIGTQVRRDETDTERVPGGLRTLTVVEPFAQAELALGSRLTLSPGTRWSSSSLWGNNVTSRLAARWSATEDVTVRASVGEGFRAPDFKELFMFFQNTNAGYAVVGNPDLRPESSRNISLGTEWVGRRQYARVQLFTTMFRDFIETQPITAGEAPVYRYANIDNGMTRGVELESGVTIAGVRAEASYAGLATRNNATGLPLLGRPTHSGRATVTAMLPFALRTNVSGMFTGSAPMQRDDATGAITSWREAFARVDVRVARTIAAAGPGGRNLELSVGVDNLFDTQPAEWAGFTGRHLYTTLSWTFNSMRQP